MARLLRSALPVLGSSSRTGSVASRSSSSFGFSGATSSSSHPWIHPGASEPWGGAADPVRADFLPMVVERTADGERGYDLYSRLMKERVIFLGGINDYTAKIMAAQLLYLEAEDSSKPIKMYVNSPGGSVSSALSIYDTMQYISAPVHTFVMGMAASAGSLLAMAGEPGHRYALRNSTIMIHQPIGGSRGQATDIKIAAQEILRLRELLTDLYVEHCKLPSETEKHARKRFDEAMERDNYMTPDQAKEFGLLDEVIKKRPSLAAVKDEKK